MRITPPTIPFHVARAYGVSPVAKVAPVRAVETSARVDGSGEGAAKVRELVAGAVPGGIDFSGAEPKPRAEALAFYRRPADANAAATSARAGRLVDLEG